MPQADRIAVELPASDSAWRNPPHEYVLPTGRSIWSSLACVLEFVVLANLGSEQTGWNSIVPSGQDCAYAGRLT